MNAVLSMSNILVMILVLLAGVNSTALAANECSEKNPNACIESANELFKKNKPVDAKKMLEEACEWKSARACLKAGIVAERENKFDEAEKFYKKSCDLNKDEKCANIDKLNTVRKPKK